MKKFRRIIGLWIAVAMMFVLSVTAFAAEAGGGTGTITITDAVDGQTYTIYRIFDLESYSEQKHAYSYKVNEKWGAWAKQQQSFVTVDSNQGYVTWKPGADPAEFAKLALAYAKAQKIQPDAAPVTAAGVPVVFDKLPLGYYLVDSSLGALCSLNTTDCTVTIQEKNAVPTIDKQVQEDSNNTWGTENDAQIGQRVNFKTVVHARKGAENYVVHDKMSEGLTFCGDLAIHVGDVPVAPSNYTVRKASDLNGGAADGCTFEIAFTQDYLDTITTDTDMVITYSAILNEKAVIADGVNTNQTKLTYGDAQSTTCSQTTTKTYRFQLVKTDTEKKVLEGAEFELYDSLENGNKVALVQAGGTNTYRAATEAEKTAEGFVSAVIKAGQACVQGLDGNTTYYLEEIKAPDGYNKLQKRQEVRLEKTNLDAVVNQDGVYESGVQVINQTGAILPSTGGIGTTIFYVVGGVMVIAAVVLLITKKRMKSDE